MNRLGVQRVAKVAAQGGVKIFLHVADGDGGQGCQLARVVVRGLGQLLDRHRAIDHADLCGVFTADYLRCEVQLPCLSCAHQVVQKIAASKVARQAHFGECSGELGIVASDAHVAGQRHRQASTGCSARDHGQRGLGHFVQPAADFHAGTQVIDLLVEAHATCGTSIRRS